MLISECALTAVSVSLGHCGTVLVCSNGSLVVNPGARRGEIKARGVHVHRVPKHFIKHANRTSLSVSPVVV